MKRILSIATAMLIGATAAEAQDVHMFVFNVHASDLADPTALRAKVAKAIDQGCGTYAGTDYIEWRAVGRCRKEAKISSDRQIADAMKKRAETQLAGAR